MESNTTIMAVEGFLLVFMFILIFILVLIALFYIKVWIPFANDKRYIKMEIERSTGKKKDFWKKQLKILYLLHIPIIGVFIINHKYKS